MPSVVADTQALVWHLFEPRRLGRAARRAFEAVDQERWTCHVPVTILVELWLLHERRRLRVAPAELLAMLARHPAYDVLPFDVEQALEFGALSSVRDPMDRMIVAAARATRSRLVTADEALTDLGIETIWD